jgi:hypothetical protein
MRGVAFYLGFIAVLAAPMVSTAQNQTGHWTVQANTGLPILDAWGQPHEVLVTVCVNTGGGIVANLTQVGANNTQKSSLMIAAGMCRSALIAMAVGDELRIAAANAAVSGTYEVAAPP